MAWIPVDLLSLVLSNSTRKPTHAAEGDVVIKLDGKFVMKTGKDAAQRRRIE